MKMKKIKILIVEDEPDISEAIEYKLGKEGYATAISPDGEEALELVKTDSPGLVILDLMLPGLDGLEVCRKMKENKVTRDIPIIMVTAKGEESDIILGLGLGADDYMTKPFSLKELAIRIKAVLRRGPLKEVGDNVVKITCGDVEVDPEKYEVIINGKTEPFTATEFRLLYHLASYPGRVFTRDQLLNVAGDDKTFVLDRNIDVHIRGIRKKLKDRSDLIETIRGVGYRFADKEMS